MNRSLLLLLVALPLFGCPPAAEKKPAASSACTKIGQSCEFSPGKLGTCVKRDDCVSGDCFVCQSQH